MMKLLQMNMFLHHMAYKSMSQNKNNNRQDMEYILNLIKNMSLRDKHNKMRIF